MGLFACGTNSPNKDISMSPAAQNYHPRESYDAACGERSPGRLLKEGEGGCFLGVWTRVCILLDLTWVIMNTGAQRYPPPADLGG